MLDQRAIDFLQNAVQARAVELDEQLHIRLRDITTEFALAGQASGSRMYAISGQEIAKELRRRAQLVFAELQRAVGLFPPASLAGLHGDLNAAFINALRPQWTHLNDLAAQRLKGGASYGAQMLGGIHGQINDEHTRLCDMYPKVELLAFAEALKQRRDASGTAAGGIVVNGNIGVFQTGSDATATVQMNVSGEDRQSLTAALDLVARVFTESRQLAHEQQRQLLEVVSAAKAAAQSTQPNETLLRGMFVVICETLQTLASAEGAMTALRTAAFPFGIVF